MNRIHVCKACANLRNGVKTRIAVEHSCGKSSEELAAEYSKRAEEAKRFRNILTAVAIVKGQGKAQGSITCPECGGALNFAIVGNNRHTRGKCQTEGCLTWVE